MNLAICACVKNEAPYIEEWLEFHILQGVDFFFITDNGSDDGTVEILERYVKKGLVTLQIDKTVPVQMKCYKYWLNKVYEAQAKVVRQQPSEFGKYFWIAFIDVDEFLFSPGGARLPDILKNYENAGAVAVHWVLYGSFRMTNEAGHYPEGGKFDLVTYRFRHRAKEVNPHIKSIVSTRWIAKPHINPHAFKLLKPAQDENGNVLGKNYALCTGGTADILRINHYHTKSREEAEKRWKIPRADTGALRDFENSFKAHDTNEMYDDSAAKWSGKVAEAIIERRKDV